MARNAGTEVMRGCCRRRLGRVAAVNQDREVRAAAVQEAAVGTREAAQVSPKRKWMRVQQKFFAAAPTKTVLGSAKVVMPPGERRI